MYYIVLILFFLSQSETKFFTFYASFDTCLIGKSCIYKTNQEKILAYSKGVPNPCSTDPIWEDFLVCEEFYFTCGYIPLANSD